MPRSSVTSGRGPIPKVDPCCRSFAQHSGRCNPRIPTATGLFSREPQLFHYVPQDSFATTSGKTGTQATGSEIFCDYCVGSHSKLASRSDKGSQGLNTCSAILRISWSSYIIKLPRKPVRSFVPDIIAESSSWVPTLQTHLNTASGSALL